MTPAIISAIMCVIFVLIGAFFSYKGKDGDLFYMAAVIAPYFILSVFG